HPAGPDGELLRPTRAVRTHAVAVACLHGAGADRLDYCRGRVADPSGAADPGGLAGASDSPRPAGPGRPRPDPRARPRPDGLARAPPGRPVLRPGAGRPAARVARRGLAGRARARP